MVDHHDEFFSQRTVGYQSGVTVEDSSGHTAEGWGETPLSVQWFWPSDLPYEPRHQALKDFCGCVCILAESFFILFGLFF